MTTARFSARAKPAKADPRVTYLTRLCLDLPDATVDQPFDDTTDVFRIHRKMFALLTSAKATPDEEILFNLKADPEMVPGLIAGNEMIRPGFHMNKRHWISVAFPNALSVNDIDPQFLEGLIEDSYDLVLSKIPQSQRRKS